MGGTFQGIDCSALVQVFLILIINIFQETLGIKLNFLKEYNNQKN